jgi:hypothetical protein
MRNPGLIKEARSAGEDNLGWLKRVARPSARNKKRSWVLLIGGADPLSVRLRMAQSHMRADLTPSAWSDVVLVGDLARDIGQTSTYGVSLAPTTWYPPSGFAPLSNAVQQDTLQSLADTRRNPNIALLALPVPTAGFLDAVHRLEHERLGLDLSALLLRWLQFGWAAGNPGNPLHEGFGFASAALLESVYAYNDFDLTPGIESRASCPEAIWQSASWWHDYYASQKCEVTGAYCQGHQLVDDMVPTATTS